MFYLFHEVYKPTYNWETTTLCYFLPNIFAGTLVGSQDAASHRSGSPTTIGLERPSGGDAFPGAENGLTLGYPLVMTNITMENHHL